MAASPSLPRTGIATEDADASLLGPYNCTPAQSIRIGAKGDSPNATLGLSLYFLNRSGVPITVQRITFTAPAVADWGTSYIGTPSIDPCWPLGGAAEVVAMVDFVSPGSTWSLDGVIA